VRVVLGDGNPLFLMGMRVALDADPAIEVAGEGVTAAGIVTVSRRLLPDLVLTDVSLPGMAFAEMLDLLSAMAPRPHLLILTAVSSASTFTAALRMGVRGYLPKNASPEEVRQAIWIISGGGSVFGPAATGWLESTLRGAPDPLGAEVLPTLSKREREVLELLCRGADNRGIARSLFIAEKTVRNHVSSIFTKLQVTHRAEAAARAREAGLGPARPAVGGTSPGPVPAAAGIADPGRYQRAAAPPATPPQS
jgi:DNA-binding NarL/FixJ family response regulator